MLSLPQKHYFSRGKSDLEILFPW